MNGKRQEIGSEFWDVPLAKQENDVFPKGTDWFISGRGALTAIIKDIKQRITFKKAALPSWCCDSVVMPFLNEGISVEFYPVFFQNGTIKRELGGVYDCDVLLTMDYFGFIRNEKPDFEGIIINDVTHSIFSGWPQYGDYIFGSLRKWAGFYTGGFAFCENRKIAVEENALDTEYIELRRLAMAKKKEYIYGNTDSKEYLDVFGEAEEFLDKYSCGKAHSEDIFAARHLDFQDIIARRRENAEYLIKRLQKYSLFSEMRKEDCPLFVPISVPAEKRVELRKFLIEKEIYCPIHWPLTDVHKIGNDEKTIYETELSIVCDQRYNLSDMEIICDTITKFLD